MPVPARSPCSSSRRPSLLRQASVIGIVFALALPGCSSTPPGASPTAPAAAARRAHPLTTERQWLQSWFAGTPVLIVQRGDGAVSIEVPREFCFDTDRSSVKPPLAAVLDKVAESLRRTPQARLPLLAAPADSATASPLALQRATQLRTHLLVRGVRAAQLGNPTTTAAAAVQLRMDVATP